jgi:hypothetical protein
MRSNLDRPRDRLGRFCRPGEEHGTIVRAGFKPRKPARSWPRDKEAIFFRELGIVCDLGLALKAAGLLRRAAEVPERLKTDAQFRAKWNAALAAGYALLDLEMLGRARFGDNRPEPETAAERKLRAIPNTVALQLLKHYHARLKGQPDGAAAPQARPLLNAREIRKRLEAKLSDFNRRMGGEG